MSEAAAALVVETPGLMPRILTGGDDYELLFTVPSRNQDSVEQVARDVGMPIRRIGEVVKTDGVVCLADDGSAIPIGPAGYAHF